MARVINIVNSILQTLLSESGICPSDPSEEELVDAVELRKLIESFISSDVDQEETLDFLDEYCDIAYEEEEEDEEEESLSLGWQQEIEINRETFSLTNMKRILAFYDSCKKKKFERTRNRYPKVVNSAYITRFRKYVAQQGTEIYALCKAMQEFEFCSENVFLQPV